MTPGRMLRPVLVCLLGLAAAGCGMVEGDPNRFENLARGVAEIPLDGIASERPAPRVVRHSEQAGLRPAMRVEVLDPHAFWDARDGMAQQAVERVAPTVVEAAAPVVAHAMVQEVSQRITVDTPMRSALAVERTTIQLGAYSSPDAARAAWVRVNGGAAQTALAGLSPAFETVEVEGRSFTRLKVSAPVETAAAICHAAQVTDPWCLRRG